jgi:hypothetical protein
MRSSWRAWVVAAVASAALSQGQAALAQGPSAYEAIKADDVAKALDRFEMKELAGAMAQQAQLASGTPDEKLARAAAIRDVDERDRLLAAAIVQLRRQAAASANATDPRRTLEHYETSAKIAKVMLVRAESYGTRLLYLQGGPEDQRKIRQITESINDVYDLRDEMNNRLGDWRAKFEYAVLAPRLGELYNTLRYQSGWLLFYRAIAIDDRQKRLNLLNDAIAAIMEFAEGDADSGIKYWSCLLVGMSMRELGMTELAVSQQRAAANFKDAEKWLRQATVDDARAPAQMQAHFELVRTLIEAGRYSDAEKAVDEFGKVVGKLLGPEGALDVDLSKTMLESYLYNSWANSAKGRDAKLEKDCRDKGQASLMGFTQRHPDPELQVRFFQIVARGFAGRDDYPNIPSAILYAMSVDMVSRGTEASKAEAAKALENLRSREDAFAKTNSAKIDELYFWLLANSADMQEKLASAKGFVALARGKGGTDEGLSAALNAVAIYSQLIEARTKAGSGYEDIRPQFIEALKVLLGDEKWRANPKAASWQLDLGMHSHQASMPLPRESKEKMALLKDAVAAYRAVAADSDAYMYAQRLALEAQVSILDLTAASAERSQLAADLVKRLTDYAASAAAKAADAKSPETARSLRDWGSNAEFRSAEIMYEELNRKAEAVKLVDGISEKWKDTPIVRDCLIFKIQKLMEQNQTDAAVAAVRALEAQYPQDAPELMRHLMKDIREQIDRLHRDGQAAATLASYRKTYYEFAKKLYDKGVEQKLPAEKMYSLEQGLADALLETGQPQEALVIYERLIGGEKKMLESRQAEIVQKVAAWQKELERARGNITAVRKLAAEFPDVLKVSGMDSQRSRWGVMVQSADKYLADLPADATPQDRDWRLKNVADRLGDGYAGIGKTLTERLPMDLTNLRGQTRCLRALKKYDDAARNYRRICAGIDQTKYPAIWWDAQLEYTECVLEGYGSDAKVMKTLAVYIGELRGNDAKMGGREAEFQACLRKARQAAGQPDSSPAPAAN